MLLHLILMINVIFQVYYFYIRTIIQTTNCYCNSSRISFSVGIVWLREFRIYNNVQWQILMNSKNSRILKPQVLTAQSTDSNSLLITHRCWHQWTKNSINWHSCDTKTGYVENFMLQLAKWWCSFMCKNGSQNSSCGQLGKGLTCTWPWRRRLGQEIEDLVFI